MTEPQLRPAGVVFLDVRRLHLVEAAAQQVSREHRLAMDRVWDEAVAANPIGLFDGPVVACARVERECPECLVLFWTRVTYRHFALRRFPGAAVLSSVFVAVVQPTDEGGLVVGRMSTSTAAPDRWQLPGGSVEPPEDHDSLDEAVLRQQAARELGEEIGVGTAPEDLSLWGVTRGEHGNIGVFFRAPSLRESVIRDQFAGLVSTEIAAGRAPELQEIAFVSSSAELTDLGSPQVDYLEPVVRRYTKTLTRRGT